VRDVQKVWRGGVSLFANFALLSLLLVMVCLAAISGFVLTKCIDEQDSGSAKMWGTLFGATSLVAAWTFGRLV
jgi:hypothetical protein